MNQIEELLLKVGKIKGYCRGFELDENVNSLRNRLNDVENMIDDFEVYLEEIKEFIR